MRGSPSVESDDIRNLPRAGWSEDVCVGPNSSHIIRWLNVKAVANGDSPVMDTTGQFEMDKVKARGCRKRMSASES